MIKFGKNWRMAATTFVFFKFEVVEVLEKNIETLKLCPAHCYSPSPVGPLAEYLLRPSAKATALCACCIANGPPAAAVPTGPSPPLVLRCSRFHRPTTCIVHHLALSAAIGRSQSLLLLFALPTARSALSPSGPLRAAPPTTSDRR
jgi:hypothetical protein